MTTAGGHSLRVGRGEYVYRTGYLNLITAKASACKLAKRYAAGGGLQDRTSNRGFASVDPELRRKIAAMGGRAAHENGTMHRFTPEEAREAGKRGGKSVARDRSYMAEIGRRGGENGKGKPKPHYRHRLLTRDTGAVCSDQADQEARAAHRQQATDLCGPRSAPGALPGQADGCAWAIAAGHPGTRRRATPRAMPRVVAEGSG